MHVAFLHTAAGHVATFERLVRERCPEVRIDHVVDEALLTQAQAQGAADPEVAASVHAALHRAAAGGAPVVVCTCSTIGGLAESMSGSGRFVAQRIDRAMADRAVASGRRILVAAALASTLAPTQDLLADSARTQGVPVDLGQLLLDGAWSHFLQGDLTGYAEAVAAGTRSAWRALPEKPDVIVLAQASMAAAVPLLQDVGVEVLSSPALGVERALASAMALQPPVTSGLSHGAVAPPAVLRAASLHRPGGPA
jgi:hypothetical protein